MPDHTPEAPPEGALEGAAGRAADAIGDPPFIFPTRVYWEDTDGGGVVYHARYVAFLERARTEWLRALGHGQEQLRQETDLVFAVRSMRMEFIRPARLDELLQVSVAVSTVRRASIVFAQRIERDGERLLEAEVRVAALRASDFRPRPITDHLYAQLNSNRGNTG